MSGSIPVERLTIPMLIGQFVNLVLFGVFAVQVFVYFRAFPKDKHWSKILVTWACFLEVAQTILAVIDAIRIFGVRWGDRHALAQVGLIWFSVPVMTGIISLTAQIFFAWRILVLSRAIWIPLIVCVVSLVQCSAAIWAGAQAHSINNLMLIQDKTFETTSVWLGGSATADIIISGSLMFYMYQSQADGLATNTVYVKVLRLIVESGSLCAAFAVLDLIMFLVYRHYNYHLAPALALSKLYSNSLLVVLNSRAFLVGSRSVLTDSGNNPNTFSLLDTPSMDARLRNMGIDTPHTHDGGKPRTII